MFLGALLGIVIVFSDNDSARGRKLCVTTSCRQPTDNVRITVVMTDDGMSNKDVQKIFTPIKENPYSDEQIQEMKALGIPKPEEVSWGTWVGPKKESHVHEALIYMAASGANQKTIAEDLGFTQSRISIILSKPEIKQKVRKVQELLWGENAEKRFNNLLPKAIDVAQHIIEDANEKTSLKADVAFKLMDRALGRPQQSVNVEGNLLGDLIARLDEQSSRDITNPELTSGREKDEVDNFVDQHVENYKVGKRDDNG